MPTMPTIRPKQALSRPLMALSPSSTEILAKPNTASMKYSPGPNSRAKWASGGAKSIKTTALAMPPSDEDTSEMRSA